MEKGVRGGRGRGEGNGRGNGRGKGEGRGGEAFIPQCSLAVDATDSRVQIAKFTQPKFKASGNKTTLTCMNFTLTVIH